MQNFKYLMPRPSAGRSLDAPNSLLEVRFRFYKERNAAPLAYFFARQKHVAEVGKTDWRDDYKVPEFLVLTYMGVW